MANPSATVISAILATSVALACSTTDGTTISPTGGAGSAASGADTSSSGAGGAAAETSSDASTAAVGGGSGVGGSTASSGGASTGGSPAVPTCADGTVASYLGTSCSQGATVYNWLSYSCASTPASICDALGPNGESVSMKMDPNGPSTILVGGSAHLYVTAGQSVDLIVAGTIYGSTRNLNWPHFQQAGQTGDGTEENITTVGCAATGDCLDANAGVCDILCSATSPTANCTEQQHDVVYEGYGAHFNAAPPDAPYSLSIEMKLSGNSGTASLRSVGTHL